MLFEPDTETCWMILVRHGATDNNRADPPRLQGRRTDPSLSPEGAAQAERTAAFLAKLPIRGVVSSPLTRARQTAEIIAGTWGMSVTTADALTEVDVGVWEGLSWPEIEQRYPEAYRDFVSDPEVNPYLEGENMGSVCRRVVPAFDHLGSEHRGKMIVVVAHNVVNRVYLAQLIGMPIGKYRSIPQENCGLNVIQWRVHRVRPVTINAAFHL